MSLSNVTYTKTLLRNFRVQSWKKFLSTVWYAASLCGTMWPQKSQGISLFVLVAMKLRVHFFLFSKLLWSTIIVIIQISQMRKLRHREIQYLILQGHTDSTGHSGDLDPADWAPSTPGWAMLCPEKRNPKAWAHVPPWQPGISSWSWKQPCLFRWSPGVCGHLSLRPLP